MKCWSNGLNWILIGLSGSIFFPVANFVLPELWRGGGQAGGHLLHVLRGASECLRQPRRRGSRNPDAGPGSEPDPGGSAVDGVQLVPWVSVNSIESVVYT